MFNQTTICLFVGAMALCVASLTLAIADNEHTGAVCIEDEADCEDRLGGWDGTHCGIMECAGGATDFSYCQISSGGGPCSLGDTASEACTNCDAWNCGPSSTGNCDFTECDTTGDPENVGNQTLTKTCTNPD